MSKLLLDEQPLVVLPSLAKNIGLNEAIALQQLNYWLQPERKPHIIDGVPWVYNTAKAWQEQFPFWGLSTIWRIFDNLEKMGLVKSGNFNKIKFDKTKWYTIDYEKLDEREADVASGSTRDSRPELTIPETTTETTMGATDDLFFGGIPEKPKDTRTGKDRIVDAISQFESNHSRSGVADAYMGEKNDENRVIELLYSVQAQSDVPLNMIPSTDRNRLWKVSKQIFENLSEGIWKLSDLESAARAFREGVLADKYSNEQFRPGYERMISDIGIWINKHRGRTETKVDMTDPGGFYG